MCAHRRPREQATIALRLVRHRQALEQATRFVLMFKLAAMTSANAPGRLFGSLRVVELIKLGIELGHDALPSLTPLLRALTGGFAMAVPVQNLCQSLISTPLQRLEGNLAASVRSRGTIISSNAAY
jgi:hypothetical protein